MKKLVIPIMVLSMVFAGCGSEAASTTEQEALTSVEVQEIEKGNINKILTYSGKVQPVQTINITSKLTGIVDTVNFEVGDEVKKGDVLFTIDTSDINDQIRQLQASLQSSQAAVNSAQLSLDQIKNGSLEQNRIQLQAAVDNAKIAYDNAQSSFNDISVTYNNMKTLYSAGAVSKQEFDQTELGYNTSKNSVDQAKLAYDTAVENLRIYDEQTVNNTLESAQQGVEQAEAGKQALNVQIQILRDSLKDAKVTSPIDGVVSQRNIEATNMVSSQAQPFVIVDTSSLTVELKVSEDIINEIKQGDIVDISIPTYSDEILQGTVKTVSPSADTTSTYPVKVEIPNNDGTIKAGMFAEVSFVKDKRQNTVVVPRDAVFEEEDGKFVYVAENDTAVKRQVETGIDNGKDIEITSGIKQGDLVIVKGQSYVTDNEKIQIVTEEN